VSLRLNAGAFLILACFLCLGQAEDAQAGIADHLVINEAHLDGVVGTGGSDDDWVEIYNPTAEDVSLDGWSIQKQAQAIDSSIYKASLSGIVPAGGYFLVVRNSAATSSLELADIEVSLSLASNNTIYLVNNDISIENKDDVNIVDFVGMGSAENFDGLGTAPSPAETHSIVRTSDGEDTNQNIDDFTETEAPTPQNSSEGAGGDEGDSALEGSVILTVTLDAEPVQNIGQTSADIVFQTNGDANAIVNHGLSDVYGSSTVEAGVIANTDAIINLDGLNCGTTYHYSVYVENADASESDESADATFTTSPCGITVDSLTMTKTSAKAKDEYADGWSWEFDITVWDPNEASLKMKFNEWNGAGILGAGGNMRFSVNNVTWIDILDNNIYPETGVDISEIDNDVLSAGRQVKIYVQMKVPAGTIVGEYNSDYGILTE